MDSIKKRLAGGGFVAGGLLLVGGETISWAWGKLLDTFSKGASVSWATFPWQNALASVLIVGGGLLLLWPAPKKPKPPTLEDEFRDLFYRSDPLVDRIKHHRQLQWFQKDRAESVVDIARDGFSLLMTFSQAGLHVPTLRSESAERVCIGMFVYFSTIGPFMRDGHVGQVQEMAEPLSRDAEKVAYAFKPETWHGNIY